MREEEPLIKEKWKKRPALEISVKTSFADRKGDDHLLANLLLMSLTHSLRFAGVTNFEYGVQTYEEILQNNLFYVTQLKLFRNPPGKCLFLCRPKRHGKTLLCSLAQCFYDVMNGSHFDEMFPGLNPADYTPRPCSFMVLPLTFGGLQPDDTTSLDCSKQFYQNFQNRLKKDLFKFNMKYELGISYPESADAIDEFQWFVLAAKMLGKPVSVMNLIDVSV
jgi:hypothetical protein